MFKHEKIVLIILCVAYAFIGLVIDHPTLQSLGLLGWLGLAQFIFCTMSWLKRGNQFISPYIIFLCCLYVFLFGQSFLWALGLESDRTLIGFYDITVKEIFYAQIQTIIMLSFFHIGAVYSLQKQKYRLYYFSLARDCSQRLKWIGWFLFFCSIVPYLSETIHAMILSMTKGYGALYEGEGKVGFNNFSGFIADYFIPSIICLFIAYRDNKIIRRFLLGFFIINIATILLTGGRSNAVVLLSILILLYNYLVHKFTARWIVVGIVGSFILLQVLAFIAQARVEGIGTATKMKVENNAAVDAIAEMGGTMFCLIKTAELVPSKQSYKYGKSYLYAFTTLIPNLGFWDIHPAKIESNLGDWLQEELNLGYGTGFSMCAEAYVNFGYFAFVVFFFWGWFLASIFGKIEISVQTKNYALLAFLMILFWYFLKLPRNNFINLIRPIFFVAGPIYLYCTKFRIRL